MEVIGSISPTLDVRQAEECTNGENPLAEALVLIFELFLLLTMLIAQLGHYVFQRIMD